MGPILGGWLVSGPGWRWIFVINLPVAVLVGVLTLRHVPESRDEQATGRFDVPGAVLAALALGGVTYALTAAGGKVTAAVWVSAGAGVLLGAAFVAVERRSPQPMMPLELFDSRLFSTINLVTLGVYGALGGVFFFLQVQLQTVAGFEPLVAGVAFAPVTVLMLLLSARSGRLASRIGPRLQLTAGPLVAAGGVLLMLRIGPHASYWADVLPAAVVFGVGLTALVAPLTATVLAAVPVHRAGIASGVNNAAARAAGLLAVAALPLLTGLSGDQYQVPSSVDSAFRTAVGICAGLLVASGLLALVTVPGRPPTPTAEPDSTWYCGTTGPPVDPGHERPGSTV